MISLSDILRKYRQMRSVSRGPSALLAAVLSLIVVTGTISGARADEADARKLLKAMSDYMAAQKAISFDYDSVLEIVTSEDQKLGLASSGAVTLNRPDKLRANRAGGFADVDMVFDGTTLSLSGNNVKLYTQIEVPGSIDNLVDTLKDKYDRPLPAADLLLTNSYDELIADVTDIKDLGSGVVNGAECDWLAFRKKDVDWQIWIAHGDTPYPCRYVVTSKKIPGGPQYTIVVRNWKSGNEVAADDFGFSKPNGSTQIDPKDLKDKMSEMPQHFKMGDAQ